MIDRTPESEDYHKTVPMHVVYFLKVILIYSSQGKQLKINGKFYQLQKLLCSCVKC